MLWCGSIADFSVDLVTPCTGNARNALLVMYPLLSFEKFGGRPKTLHHPTP